jgi:hypothetical protein
MFRTGCAVCLTVIIAAFAISPARAASVPFWGAHASMPAETPINSLKKGEFLWLGDAFTSGPVVMVVSLTEQRAYVYRNGILVGATTVSTGRPGHVTPTGVFTVLQKQKEHRSTIYDSAPMPYMERLTWSGVALHAGGIPGYPESHGCIHLPTEFARLLYEISPAGMTVVIANDHTDPERVAHPGYLAPVAVSGGQPVAREPLATDADERWQPELSPTGPVSIVLSQGSHRVVVYRNGVEIGRARLTVTGGVHLTSHALVLMESPGGGPDPYVPDAAKYRWVRVGLPGYMGESGTPVDPVARAHVSIPDTFVRQVNAIMTPGTTVLVTQQALSPRTSGPVMQIVDADPPAEKRASRL